MLRRGPHEAPWPAVDEPHELLDEISRLAGWLRQPRHPPHVRRRTRPTHEPAADLRRTGAKDPTTRLAHGGRPLHGGSSASARHPPAGRHAPPPAARGRFRHLHWFRWCASQRHRPPAPPPPHTSRPGCAPSTTPAPPSPPATGILATVKALYTHLADVGLAAGNPAALDRRRLGPRRRPPATPPAPSSSPPARSARSTPPPHAPRRGASPADTARATAVVALFTLGLRVSELCDLDRADLHVTRGRRALRVTGKGGKTRVVYLHAAAERALTDYLRERDHARTAPARRDRPRPTPAPGHPHRQPATRQAVWQLLRRLAAPPATATSPAPAPARAAPLLRHHRRRSRRPTRPRPGRRRPHQRRHHRTGLQQRRPRPVPQRRRPRRRRPGPGRLNPPRRWPCLVTRRASPIDTLGRW